MLDSAVSTFGERNSPWLMLIHQLPPKPDYLRVKVRRRLKGIGAVALKSTVYLLPNSDESHEDFEWLRQEIEAEGGSAIIAEAGFIAGLTDAEVEEMLASEHGARVSAAVPAAQPQGVDPGQVWVTRSDVHIDRIASAWLIGRFIDLNAQFKFVQARGYKPLKAELRFDMFEGEYTHVGDDCSFQTLSRAFGLSEKAIVTIGEIVHDLDFKVSRYGHAETAGIASLVSGVIEQWPDDPDRIERGRVLFDMLYESLRRRSN